ncbi:MAG: hypothetical protein AAF353_20165 [Pseudomonadota bacterium]
MSEKQEIIRQMLEIQRKFISIEHSGQFRADDYYDSDGDSDLARFKKTYDALATQLVDMAHAEKGSHR